MNQIKINYYYEIVLALLKKEAHGRELAKELKASLTTIQRALLDLMSYNVLDYKTEGKNHVFFMKKNLVAKTFVMNSENYKLAKLLRRYSFLEPLFKEITERYPNLLIVLFGSYAKFIPREGSDIDIYVNTSDEKAKENIEKLHDNINIKIGKFNKEDLLIQEIIKNHVIIQGAELYYERLGFFK